MIKQPEQEIIITIQKVYDIKSTDKKIFILVTPHSQFNKRSIIYQDITDRKTGLKNRDDKQWNQNFHFNTRQFKNDEITFILLQEDGTQLGRNSKIQLKQFQNVSKQKNQHYIQLLSSVSKQVVAKLNVRVKKIQNVDVFGGIEMPKLSLVPTIKDAKYNAVQTYMPGKKTGLKPNCFSVCDGHDLSQGFNNIKLIPHKYKRMNN